MRTLIPGEIKSVLVRKPSFAYYGGIAILILSVIALFFISRLINAFVGLFASLFLFEYRRRFEERKQQELSAILYSFKNTNFDGQYNPNTAVGKQEKPFSKLLQENGFEVSKAPPHYFCVIIPQYELSMLNWGKRDDGSTKNYTADFAYLDQAKGIKIDIEIDEAYHKSKEEKARMQNRNAVFLGRGWFVVRIWDDEVSAESVDCVKKLVTGLERRDIGHLTSFP